MNNKRQQKAKRGEHARKKDSSVKATKKRGGNKSANDVSVSASVSASVSVRKKYETLGVLDYYKMEGKDYLNPHDAAIKKIISLSFEKWTARKNEDIGTCNTTTSSGSSNSNNSNSSNKNSSISSNNNNNITSNNNNNNDSSKSNNNSSKSNHNSSSNNVSGLIESKHGSSIRVLDLACGSGEATLALSEYFQDSKFRCEFTATDPYTHEAYEIRTKIKSQKYSFLDIANGCYSDLRFDIVISSFALHLASKSLLWALLTELSRISRYLIVLTPHKRPQIELSMGWKMLDEVRAERIRCRLYLSTLHMR